MKKETFEERFKRLEEIVVSLEKGNLDLEESLDLYKEGITLTKTCQAILENAELRVKKILESSAETPHSTEPFVIPDDTTKDESDE